MSNWTRKYFKLLPPSTNWLANIFICPMKIALISIIGFVTMAFHPVLSQQKMNKKALMVIHGGAGVITREKLSESLEKEYRNELAKTLQIGYKILKKGGSSEEAVVEAIINMEDSPLFNAGVGSVLNENGNVEMDASIMNGVDQKCGAVAGVRRIKNPIKAAQLVMNKTKHVFIMGEGADELGEKNDLPIEPPEYFQTERRIKQLEERKKKGNRRGSLIFPDSKFGTVGVVALDQRGNICAGTSTGGTSNKLKGRIGDSPIIGSGTYADNNSCGVSATGDGEFFIRAQAAYSVAAFMEIGGKDLDSSLKEVMDKKIGPLGGQGGLIGLDKDGNYSWYFNSEGMYRGVLFEDGTMLVEIFGSP